ncbi:unnamed protein product [Pelagomonas calceolata]|uniref:Uncharacterized protein n=1 Tax=Pelagomonas calceolata TaxID=35677 RepID=A0A8J2SXB3_9STRA|nr:unnamed protein product [Pelagomonas calceolata]|mmetsp:Transcript_7763/g.22955  ORF Transcript_7763/g.22955 Transcript_7763/m.22955 type:complete len:540 (-) Transcript_7763:31-1650(-)
MAAAAAEADAKIMAEKLPEGNMKVLVDVGGAGLSRRRMEIPVGPGTQSLKWLGLVAAQRHALLAKHTKTGRRSKQGAQPDEGQGFFLPEDMIGPGGRLAPTSIIRDVIREGDVIQVDLQTSVELDEINAPVQTPWQVAAFECGAAGAQRRRGIESREAIAAHEASIKAEVDARIEGDERYRRAYAASALALRRHVPPPGTDYHVVVAGRLVDQADLDAALDLDWPVLERALSDLKCPVSGTASEAFRDDLQEVYGDLNAVFCLYAGLGRVGAPHGATPRDLAHVAHACRLALVRYGAEDRRADRDRVHQTFEGARRGRFAEAKECDEEDDAATVTTPAALLSRAEFVAALIALARSADPGAPTLLDEAQGDDDVHGEGPKKTTRPAPSSTIDALEVLATRHVAPLLARRRESVVACFDGAAIQDAVFERQAPLRRAFDHYADGDGMTLAGFGSVVRASSLGELVLADEEEGDRALDDRCRAAFRGAQGAPAGVLALDALVFGEFLEAYCAAAADLLGAESCERGMLLGLDLLCDLSMKL